MLVEEKLTKALNLTKWETETLKEYLSFGNIPAEIYFAFLDVKRKALKFLGKDLIDISIEVLISCYSLKELIRDVLLKLERIEA